jgi:hypothetical protein
MSAMCLKDWLKVVDDKFEDELENDHESKVLD